MVILEAPVSDWVLFFGHFHPVVVHLPIGMLLIAVIQYFFASQKSVPYVFFWAFISAVFSCLMGWALSQSGEYDENTLFFHQWLGVAVAVLSGALAYMTAYWTQDAAMARLIKPSLVTSVVLITVTGHFGGNLTHGSDYLTAYLPQPIRGWVGMEPRAEQGSTNEPTIRKIANIQTALIYQDLVQPVLKQKCWSCHNAEKQKGKLRMDSPEFLLAGGEDGAIIKAGFPEESEILKRLLLPESDEHHMPPKGKPGFSEEEINLLHWWLKEGADFKKKVKDASPDTKIKTLLARYSSGESTGPYLSPVFKLSISEADESDVKDLQKLGLLVTPSAKDQPFLEVNAVNAQGLGDKELEGLANIQEQIVSLKLGKTKISDATLKQVANMPLLIFLALDHTKITDKNLSALEGLRYLESLNLYGTQVSDAGLASLAKIKSLKHLYVWQSKVSDAGIATFKKARPGVLIDNGFKGKWPLEIDTVRVEEKAK